ncbi:hypothetical protein K438DRAFT_1988848 [Mycena galopus ATCC 62051]|nr:hypothetical protein K438DRAFT_1988848 [Mycena galopus ATCC 62051]
MDPFRQHPPLEDNKIYCFHYLRVHQNLLIPKRSYPLETTLDARSPALVLSLVRLVSDRTYGDRLPIPSLSTPVVPTWARANLSPVLESARQSDSPPLCDLKTSPRRRRCTAVGKYLSAHQLNGVLLYVLPPQSSS